MLRNGTILHLAIFWILLSLCGELYSQGNSVPGYIVDLHGDTVRGLVSFKRSYANPMEINFQKTEETYDQVSYTPAQIRGFGSDQGIYESCVVDLNIGPADFEVLKTDKEVQIIKDTVFLKVLFSGPKSLFLYTSRKGKCNFYISAGATPELLIYQKYLRYLDNTIGDKAIMVNKKYVGQLLLLFADMPELNSRIQKTSYESNHMMNLFSLYYKRSQHQPVYEQKRVVLSDQAGMIGSFTSTRLFFYGDYSPANFNFPASKNASAGIFYDKSLGTLGRYSINNELVYTAMKTSGSINYTYSHLSGTNTYNFQLNYLKLNTSVRTKILLPFGRLFFEFGISNGLLIAEKDEVKGVSSSYLGHYTSKEKILGTVKNIEQSLFAGIGLQYHRMGLFYRIEKGNGFSGDPWPKISSQRQYLSFTYSFLR